LSSNRHEPPRVKGKDTAKDSDRPLPRGLRQLLSGRRRKVRLQVQRKVAKVATTTLLSTSSKLPHRPAVVVVVVPAALVLLGEPLLQQEPTSRYPKVRGPAQVRPRALVALRISISYVITHSFSSSGKSCRLSLACSSPSSSRSAPVIRISRN
jgi:hypothetical protein